MALTAAELRDQVLIRVNAPRQGDWGDQNEVSVSRGLHTKLDYQLPELEQQYRDILRGTVAEYQEYIDTLEELVENTDLSQITFKSRIRRMLSKLNRIGDKHAAVKLEIEGRAFGHFDRSLIMRGTDYYIDLDNGSNTSPHDGLRYPSTSTYTADSGTGTTTLIEDSELGRTTDDDWNGAYLYNATRGIGVLITDSAYAGGTWTLTHPTITGQTSGDNYYIIDAWLTLEQYTQTTGRSAGDTAHVRANTTQVAGGGDLDCDENGSNLLALTILGCDSVVDDPWVDSSDVKPTYDFDGSIYEFTMNNINWHIRRMGFFGTTGSVILGAGGYNNWYMACDFADADVYPQASTNTYFVDCTISDPGSGSAVGGLSAFAVFKRCIINASAGGTDYGVSAYRGCYYYLIDCEIGLTTAFDLAALRVDKNGHLFCRNVKYDASGVELHGYCGTVNIEDDNGVFEAQTLYKGVGVITRNTTTVRSGGADSSMELIPNSGCSVMRPLNSQMVGHAQEGNFPILYDPLFRYWATASVEITMNIWMRADAAWSTYPTASELWATFSYLSSGSTADRTEVNSTAVLSDGSTWVAFSATFTPQRTGWVYADVWLGLYEASRSVLVDIEPVIT